MRLLPPLSSFRVTPVLPSISTPPNQKYSSLLRLLLRCLFLRPIDSTRLATTLHFIFSIFLVFIQICFVVLNLPQRLPLSSVDDFVPAFVTILAISSLASSLLLLTLKDDDISEFYEDGFQLPKKRKNWQIWLPLLVQLSISSLCTIATVYSIMSLRTNIYASYRILYSLLLTMVSARLFFSLSVFSSMLHCACRSAQEVVSELESFKGGPLQVLAFRLQRVRRCLRLLSRMTSFGLGSCLLVIPLLLTDVLYSNSMLLLVPLLPLLSVALVLLIQAVQLTTKVGRLKELAPRLFDFQLMAGSTSVMISYFSFWSRVEVLDQLTLLGVIPISCPILGVAFLTTVVAYIQFISSIK